MNNAKDIRDYIDPKMFEGKSTDEIVAICNKLFGEISSTSRGTCFSDALSKGTVNHLADRIKEITSKRYQQNEVVSDEIKKMMEQEFGSYGNEERTLGENAAKAIQDEVEAIIGEGLKFKPELSKEEIERRVSVLELGADGELINKLAEEALPGYYLTEQDQVGELLKTDPKKGFEQLQKDLPNFLNFVEVLEDKGIPLKQVRVEKQTLEDINMMIHERYGQYIPQIMQPKMENQMEPEVIEAPSMEPKPLPDPEFIDELNKGQIGLEAPDPEPTPEPIQHEVREFEEAPMPVNKPVQQRNLDLSHLTLEELFAQQALLQQEIAKRLSMQAEMQQTNTGMIK